MERLSLDSQKVLALSLFLGLAILGIDYFFVISPVWNKYQSAREQYTSIEKKLKASRAKVKDSELLIYIKNMRDKIADLEKRIVTDVDMTFVLEDISGLAKDSGLVLKQILPKKEIPLKGKYKKNLYYEQLLFTGKGTYHSLGKFISRLENSKYVCKIESITILPNINDYHNNDVRVTIDILSRKE